MTPTEKENVFTLPLAPKVTPLRITDEEQSHLTAVAKLATDTRKALEATDEYKNAKATADAAREAQAALEATAEFRNNTATLDAVKKAQTDIAKKYGLGNGDALDKDGVIVRAKPRPGMPGQQGPRPAQFSR